MYSSSTGLFTVDKKFLTTVEPLLLKNKVVFNSSPHMELTLKRFSIDLDSTWN